MTPESILQAEILDILFEGRNKEYGAYELRKYYGSRMKKAMITVFALVCATCIFAFLPSSKVRVIFDDPIPTPPLELKPINIPDIEPPKPPEPSPVRSATIQYSKPVIVNEDVDQTVPELSELAKDVAIGTETIDGPPATTTALPPAAEEGEGSKPVEQVVKPKEEILQSSQIMPEFPGGQAAFMRFLSKNLRVPEDELQEGGKVKIVVRFVVGKDGELSNLVFLDTKGEAFEREVLRVMKKMPRWKPGSQNGENVAVYFNLPIIFDSGQE